MVDYAAWPKLMDPAEKGQEVAGCWQSVQCKDALLSQVERDCVALLSACGESWWHLEFQH